MEFTSILKIILHNTVMVGYIHKIYTRAHTQIHPDASREAKESDRHGIREHERTT